MRPSRVHTFTRTTSLVEHHARVDDPPQPADRGGIAVEHAPG